MVFGTDTLKMDSFKPDEFSEESLKSLKDKNLDKGQSLGGKDFKIKLIEEETIGLSGSNNSSEHDIYQSVSDTF